MGLVFFLLVYFAGFVAHGRDMKVGLLMEVDNCCSFMSLENSVGAISIALDALKTDGIWTGNISFTWRHAVRTNEGVAKVVELVRDEGVDLILGSASSIPTIPAAHLTAEWNFPHISWGAASFQLSNKELYSTFIRTRGSISSWGYLVVSLFDKLGWKQFGMMFVNHRLCKYCADGLMDSIAPTNIITVTTTIRLPYDQFIPNIDIDVHFQRLKKTSRIIYICVDLADIRRYLIRACLLGMCEGDYIFIYPQYNFVEENIVIQNDGLDSIARKGFRHVLLITLAAWFEETGRLQYEDFQHRVIARAAEYPWFNTDAQRLNQTASSIAPYLYNSIYLYGLWLNFSSTHGLDPRNGTGLMEFSKDLSFKGVTGPVLFQSNGDILPLLWVSQFSGENMSANVVLDPGYQLTFGVNLAWYTRDGRPPSDAPVCGFFNEFCLPVITAEDQGYIVITSTLVSISVVVTLAVIAVVVLRRKKTMKASWKVDPKAVVRIDVKRGLTSEATLRSELSLSHAKSFQSSLSGTGARTLKTAIYNGNTVVIRSVNQSFVLKHGDIHELEKMKDMIHININPFIGACFNDPNPMVLFQYCSKGCLQDMLENTDIALDKTLLKSLIYDLVLGVKYIHESPLESHGRLKSTNCMIDERWTLKITDYGINSFADTDIRIQESEKFKGMLWTAPEILESPHQYNKGSKAGDVYSVAIILHEIVFRMGVFAGWEDMTSEVIYVSSYKVLIPNAYGLDMAISLCAHNIIKDRLRNEKVDQVVRHVRNREVTPMRPRIFTKTSFVSASPLVDLMKICWSDEQGNRPVMKDVKRTIAKILKVSEEGNFAEVVQKRLMKYAENLEAIVNRRTQLLFEEKQKTETLLYRMLPKYIADKLKAGFPVHPEEFESATVYFSDIVGFTSIAGESTPIQVVDFLNDLYSDLDALIGRYDAYKVETIGDAYMVVSGVPVKNGNQHTAIIADMALAIKATVGSFHIHHLPSKVLQFRSGFHTGPCCAGVVGLTMPKYCLFGDTVNVASRMESHGEGQKIQISHQAYTQLSKLGPYVCEFRAELEIKGKGKMRTYWLHGKQDRLTPATTSKLELGQKTEDQISITEICG